MTEPVDLSERRKAFHDERLALLGEFIDRLTFTPDEGYGGWDGGDITLPAAFIRRAQAFWQRHYPRARDFTEFLAALDADVRQACRHPTA